MPVTEKAVAVYKIRNVVLDLKNINDVIKNIHLAIASFILSMF